MPSLSWRGVASVSHARIATAVLLGFALLTGAAHAQVGQAVEGDVPPGYMIIEGDILVPDTFYTSATYGGSGWRLWLDNDVPYAFASSVTSANRTRMLDAMAEWEAVTAVDFLARTSQPDYIYIQDSSANNSFVGRQGGRQVMNIHDWGFRFVMAHELGHALGYWHEHTRPDRGAFIQINSANIQAGSEHNFTTHAGQVAYGPYDFDSVMHYDDCAFSVCCPLGQACSCSSSCRTITVLPPNEVWQQGIGQLSHLSFWDGRLMSFLYAESNWRFVNRAFTGSQSGTFLNPWKTLSSGISSVPSRGRLWIEPGRYSDTGRFTKAMTWDAPRGGVVIGRP